VHADADLTRATASLEDRVGVLEPLLPNLNRGSLVAVLPPMFSYSR
jgi:hypothetical protein